MGGKKMRKEKEANTFKQSKIKNLVCESTDGIKMIKIVE